MESFLVQKKKKNFCLLIVYAGFLLRKDFTVKVGSSRHSVAHKLVVTYVKMETKYTTWLILMLGFCIHTLGIFWFIFLLLSAFTFVLGWVVLLQVIDTDTGYLSCFMYQSLVIIRFSPPFYRILTILYLNHDDMDTYLNKNPSDNPLESLETKSLGLNIRKSCKITTSLVLRT